MMDSEEVLPPLGVAPGAAANVRPSGAGPAAAPNQAKGNTTLIAAPPGFDFSPGVWRDLILSAFPAFFGLMGLAQLREGRWSRGVAFLITGLVLGGLSSWFLILPSRIGELVSAQPMPAVSSFSWLYSVLGGSITSSWVIALSLSAFLLVWIVQLLDTVTYINKYSAVKVLQPGS